MKYMIGAQILTVVGSLMFGKSAGMKMDRHTFTAVDVCMSYDMGKHLQLHI